MCSILIADPDPISRMMIKENVTLLSGSKNIVETLCSAETSRIITVMLPEIIFFDANLSGKDSFNLLKDLNYSPLIIIISSESLHAQSAYDLNALDFLSKPFKKERLEKTVRKLISIMKVKSKSVTTPYLFVPNGNGFSRIESAQIRYIKAARDYTVLYTEDREWISSIGISKIVIKLEPLLFKRVHRSYIVNLSWVDRIVRSGSNTSLLLKDGSEIIVGKSYIAVIKALLL